MGRRMHAAYVVGVVALLLGVTAPGLASAAPAADGATAPTRVFAPYFDASSGNLGFLGTAVDAHGLKAVTAAFVIGSPNVGNGCTPLWDDYSRVATNASMTNALSAARQKGVRVVASFGGAGGLDLARSCTDVAMLTKAYQAVITKLGITDIDFDIEGVAIGTTAPAKAAATRRFTAIRNVERATGVTVSLTLPVGQNGLAPTGLAMVRKAKSAGVGVDLVNIMAMDYDQDVQDMGAAAVSAAQGTLRQLKTVWPSYGYADIGITPMIGLNDSGEVFTWQHSQDLAAWARANGVGRIAFWSLNRDQQCPAGTDTGVAQPNCSGLPQDPYVYTGSLADSYQS